MRRSSELQSLEVILETRRCDFFFIEGHSIASNCYTYIVGACKHIEGLEFCNQ